MPTILGPTLPPDWMGDLPHALSIDLPTWNRYWRQLTPRPLHLWVDVGLGDVPLPDHAAGQSYKDMWIRLNQRRADAILEYPDYVAIVEVHAAPNPASLGRLVHYRHMLKKDDPWHKPIKLVLVSDVPEPDLIAAAWEMNISYVVPPELP